MTRALIFDLDGTLIDTVYAHVFSWHRATTDDALDVDACVVHRLIGKTGDLLLDEISRLLRTPLDDSRREALKKSHGRYFKQFASERRPLTGAVHLVQELRKRKIPFGIATSSEEAECRASLKALKIPDDVVVIKHEDVAASKPSPDMFMACREKLGASAADCFVIGDAVWDLLAAKRAGMLAVGLTSGGIGADALRKAGAYRVYRGPDELLEHLSDLGF